MAFAHTYVKVDQAFLSETAEERDDIDHEKERITKLQQARQPKTTKERYRE
jgi:hypothetical protein